MNEQKIRKLAAQTIEKGERVWFAPRVRYYKEQDIFNCFDMILLDNDGEASFVQLTTTSHKANREQKIRRVFKRATLPKRSFIWAFNTKNKTFMEFQI